MVSKIIDWSYNIALEHILYEDPHVQNSVMFGRGRFNAGILVDPAPQYIFDPKDERKLAEFRDKIWYVLVGFIKT